MARYVAGPCCQIYTCPIGKIFFCLLRPDIFLLSKVRYLAAHRVRYFLGLLGQIIPPRSHILICTYSEHVFFFLSRTSHSFYLNIYTYYSFYSFCSLFFIIFFSNLQPRNKSLHPFYLTLYVSLYFDSPKLVKRAA